MKNEVLWRDTALTPKILFLDARAVVPVCVWLFHWSYWTAYIAIIGVGALCIIQRTGMPPLTYLRAIRVRLLGNKRETRQDTVVMRQRCRW